ncbi:echinoderm microtubule-associated protein-like 2 isoform X3 [Halyomorpha halys]|uniref:echinoderm microtubule-associated protein-like 2 isoform X3 n=1 Tax=Halyomorpha halys TaxID=286706 RepID=UPI0006D4D8A0|nr:echinoderm microtubule-associated protein-like 2 isoform X3 [Halyomorpha halys]
MKIKGRDINIGEQLVFEEFTIWSVINSPHPGDGAMKIEGVLEEGDNHLETSPSPDEMILSEDESMRERLCDLEKKVLSQGEELACLRSTLADVLRRIAALEIAKPQANNRSSPGNSPRENTGLRYRNARDVPNGREPVRRVQSSTPTSLPHRRGVHYQSTGSLHSDSPSSSSVSPPQTPLMRQSPTNPAPRTIPTPSSLNKRWSSTGDFSNQQQTSGGMVPAHSSSRCVEYNEEDGSLRMYLRGRPVMLYAPSNLIETYDVAKVAAPPQQRLKLEWAYGYRGKDCRNNLYLLPTGEMVYFVAAVVVLYNVEEQTQRHYLGHNDDVKCLAVHPNRMTLASGQACGHDGRAHIRVWDSVSLATYAVVGLGEIHASVACLTFSKTDGGTYLCAIDDANEHNISIWDWQRSDKGLKVTETKCSVDTVVGCEWHPLDKGSIVTCGKNHISFWSLDQSGALYKRLGVFASREKPKYVTCLAFTHTGDVLSGDSNGNIIVWGRGTNSIAKMVLKIHDGPIFSLCVLKDGSIVSGGGKDGVIKQLDSNLEPTGYETKIAGHLGGVRTVAQGRGPQLLVGSTKNCILSGSFDLGFSDVVLGHTSEVWALAAHPSLQQFVTAGWDSILQLWDSMSRTVVWSKDIGEEGQSACFSPDGQSIIVGCSTGKWLHVDADSREILTSHTDGSEPIQVVCFSPNSEMLALGSRDNNIYVYQLGTSAGKYSRIGRCTTEKRKRKTTPTLISLLGHSSFITHLDWSVDSQYLRSNSGDYEVLYWSPSVCRQITQPSKMRDVEWASQTCTLSFTSIGAWPEGADGTDVNASAAAGGLLATGDDWGKVKLYSWPTIQPKSICHNYGGHSSHVTNVTFLADESRLISAGGRDTSVLQWRIV